jgi:hypothetical protein
MIALSKVRHLLTQYVEGNSSSDSYWSVGNSNKEVEVLINKPLKQIDKEVENQITAKVNTLINIKNEIDELYRINLEINKSWKGKLLRLLGIFLPDNDQIKIGGVNAKGESIIINKV